MSDDTIYRKDAIKALNREKSDWNCDYNVPIDNCIKRLNKVKSADRPQGEWIFRREFVKDTPFTGYRCSNCNYWKGMGAWNFCPNCGARMFAKDINVPNKKGADDE